jgi:hypothetical protein
LAVSKPDQSIRWSKRERALLYHFEREKPTSMLIAHVFESVKMGEMNGHLCGGECKRNGWHVRVSDGRPPDPADQRTFAEELDARGYDLTTLRFSIRRKTAP